MQKMILFLCLALASCVSAKPALLPALPPAAPFAAFPGAGAPFAAYTAPGPFAPAPLAISSSQRLDYFNQFNAAFAPPPARLVATPAGLAAVPTFPAPARLIQPARLIAPAPFFF
ncbi:uncharacterized protein LOC115632778 [Scaptodrosophila lebanonensis]|uniref:Uncharacterized protein LOC115632778 n=1 Tax=Drosophila lebanonensis TaxID=7225 RepID=A0A6J2UFK6_DROLE|nr:uncharacterized protein LOC115632778 [Scaptodrosophila lebanonensis]